MTRSLGVRVLAGTLFMCALTASRGQADGQNDDACGAVLCLAGRMQGDDGGHGCRQYEADYFSIVRYRHGHFDAGGTSNARGDFLDGCRPADASQKKGINAAYGSVERAP